MNAPRNVSWEEELPEATAVRSDSVEADVPVLGADTRGHQLETARARDEQWRAERRDQLSANLEHARILEVEGKSTTRIAGSMLVGSLVLGAAGCTLTLTGVGAIVGVPAVLLALVGAISAVILLLMGGFFQLTGLARRTILLDQAQCKAIEVRDPGDGE